MCAYLISYFFPLVLMCIWFHFDPIFFSFGIHYYISFWYVKWSADGVNDWERSIVMFLVWEQSEIERTNLRKLQIKIWKVNRGLVCAFFWDKCNLVLLLHTCMHAKKSASFSIKAETTMECITLRHRKWRMQSTRKTADGNMKITKQPKKERKKHWPCYWLAWVSSVCSKKSNISSRASILNLTTNYSLIFGAWCYRANKRVHTYRCRSFCWMVNAHRVSAI